MFSTVPEFHSGRGSTIKRGIPISIITIIIPTLLLIIKSAVGSMGNGQPTAA
jgi:hypothetical protein